MYTDAGLVTAIDYTNKQNDHAMIQTTYLDTYVNNRISNFFSVYICVFWLFNQRIVLKLKSKWKTSMAYLLKENILFLIQ